MNSDVIDSISYINNSDEWAFGYNCPDFQGKNYNPWIGSVIGSIVVGLSGIFPLIVIPIDGGASITKGVGARRLKLLLSFAVGGLLGDVFLHLLPEAWQHNHPPPLSSKGGSHFCGLWVLTGLLVFTIIEKVFSVDELSPDSEPQPVVNTNNNIHDKPAKQANTRHMSGYLNLLANVIDNFSHGLAVGGSFLVSARVGVLSTVAILVHEVPHEVGDFAVLLRAGFSRLEAARAQLATATSSLFGACAAILFSGATDTIEAHTSWILPFTSGGFLHIALVVVLPDLLEEKDPGESVKQICSLVLGITVMATMTFIID